MLPDREFWRFQGSNKVCRRVVVNEDVNDAAENKLDLTTPLQILLNLLNLQNQR